MAELDLSRFAWRKSSLSGNGPDCVEVASLNAGRVGVRDSKDRSGPALIFAATEWHAFIGRIRSGGFDDLAI
ncbi:DUF397 domain-containing protein [Streptosporangium sp. H16]|uniref:DUF397 domain-containing protein n=1 Tax=Streptosporangium sp. H16 TaxID=3444184 RepID=UPI003F78B4BE